MTLTDFLLARIGEDESAATAIKYDAPEGYSASFGWGYDTQGADSRGPTYLTVDAARVLAECEAKRRIVTEHAEQRVSAVLLDPGSQITQKSALAAFNSRAGTECARCFDQGPVSAPCLTLRLLALPYAEHPDYREEWRP